MFVFRVFICHTVTCWERAGLLCGMFTCDFGTFPYSVLGQVWYLIVSIPDLSLLPYYGSDNDFYPRVKHHCTCPVCNKTPFHLINK